MGDGMQSFFTRVAAVMAQSENAQWVALGEAESVTGMLEQGTSVAKIKQAMSLPGGAFGFGFVVPAPLGDATLILSDTGYFAGMSGFSYGHVVHELNVVCGALRMTYAQMIDAWEQFRDDHPLLNALDAARLFKALAVRKRSLL